MKKAEIEQAISEFENIIDKILPLRKRKLYPFHHFITFKERSNPDSEFQCKELKHMICDTCGMDCTESGNGSYYSGYLVFEEGKEIKIACSRECRPHNSMDFYDQKYGFRQPIVFPEKFNKSIRHKLVWSTIFSHKEYAIRYYISKGTEEKNISRIIKRNFKSHSGGTHECGFYQFVPKKRAIFYGKNINSTKNMIKQGEAIQIAKEIIRHQEPIQLELF